MDGLCEHEAWAGGCSFLAAWASRLNIMAGTGNGSCSCTWPRRLNMRAVRMARNPDRNAGCSASLVLAAALINR
jgi:hypothetical protein